MSVKRIEMLQGIGFVEDVTDVVLDVIKAKPNKGNTAIMERIEWADEYHVYKSENGTFTVYAENCLVTKAEQTKYSKILKAEFVDCEKTIDKSGQWAEWIEAK